LGRRAESGHALIEVTLGLTFLAVALLGIFAAASSSLKLSRTTTDTQAALTAIRAQLAEMRARPYATVLASYEGAGFDVPGLVRRPGDATAGRIRFLNEAETATRWGTAADLDGDGVAWEVEAPHAGFRILPVRVEVDWRDEGGDRHVEVHAIVYSPEGT